MQPFFSIMVRGRPVIWAAILLCGALLTVISFASCYPEFNFVMCFAFLDYALGEVIVIVVLVMAFHLLFGLLNFFCSNHKFILDLILNLINLLNTVVQIFLWLLKLLYKLLELLQLWSSNNSRSPATRSIRHTWRDNRDSFELFFVILLIIVMMIIANNQDTTVNIVK